ncbi:uncharacterized protein LOC126564731 [Anopheles maculipalpis]|uniref:uncharacterized protein LOC126564731 n=1 Tax=Anopheles maculipalpis TaxID=1496333 RepID=UPI00215915B8|nr:uncharacterized protein LOC126564731 [Anopheles maculipalpis]
MVHPRAFFRNIQRRLPAGHLNGARTVMTTGMGCSSSVVLEESVPHPTTPVVDTDGEGRYAPSLVPNQPESIVDAYRRLDEEICVLESTTPGPRLMTAEAWVELLKSGNTSQSQPPPTPPLPNEVLPNGSIPNGVPGGVLKRPPVSPDTNSVTENARKEMVKIILKLDIVSNQFKAAQQEEFIARLSRTAMDQEADHFREEMIIHSQKRALTLRASFERLKRLYHEQDRLLGSVYNGAYGTMNEQKLDAELDSARDVRDRLGGAVEQWRIAGGLLRAAAKGLHQAVDHWELIRPTKNAEETITLALDARTTCHGALMALEAAQAALPSVEIPYITIRQQSAVRHALIYLLTDMVNPARYQHTRDVFGVFSANVTKAVNWLHECYNETLKQDFDSADQAATLLAKHLREERLRYIVSKMPNRSYARAAIG